MKVDLANYERRDGDLYAPGDYYGQGGDLYGSIEDLVVAVCDRHIADGYDLDDISSLPDEIIVCRALSNHDPEGVQETIRDLTAEVVELLVEQLQSSWGGDDDDGLERERVEAARGLISSAVIGVVRTYSVQRHVPALDLSLPPGWWEPYLREASEKEEDRTRPHPGHDGGEP